VIEEFTNLRQASYISKVKKVTLEDFIPRFEKEMIATEARFQE
jgi:hypothetical protein